MTNRAISHFNQLRPVSVGFDNVFDHFERMFEDDFITNMPSFPHYNIVKTGDYSVASQYSQTLANEKKLIDVLTDDVTENILNTIVLKLDDL